MIHGKLRQAGKLEPHCCSNAHEEKFALSAKKRAALAALFGQFTDSYFALVSVFASLKTLRTSARNGLASEGAGTEPESVFRQLTLLP